MDCYQPEDLADYPRCFELPFDSYQQNHRHFKLTTISLALFFKKKESLHCPFQRSILNSLI